MLFCLDKMPSCPNCEYKTSCERFKITLGIPGKFISLLLRHRDCSKGDDILHTEAAIDVHYKQSIIVLLYIFLEQYFVQNVICYCSNCCDARGEHRVAVSGDPPQEYSRPVGWCKFELRSNTSHITTLSVYEC